MARLLSTILGLMLFTLSGAAQSPSYGAADAALNSGIARLQRAEYQEANGDFERALDGYAAANRLEEAKHAYMRMFVGNRMYSNFLMKAMKAWVEKRRAAAADQDSATLAAFEAWVQERDALAAATVNLGHNSPDWK